ncbi:type VI secretion system-associated protein TagF [Roseibium sp. SCP14]|uniref:type VI secretion system-associated protein TagF n=1 Tax=Roseibium sp. SCP14 TaxID=3141375 RepID=UPI00333D1676
MEQCGYFGKRPLERDFVYEGLTAGMADAWAGIMSDWLISVQNALPQTWQQEYFDAPAWRFAISPGLLGASAWCGLLCASADTFGRAFPLSLLMPTRGPLFQLVFDRSVEHTLDTLEVHVMTFIEGQTDRRQFLDRIKSGSEPLVSPSGPSQSRKSIELRKNDHALRMEFARNDGGTMIAENAYSLPAIQISQADVPLSYWWQDGTTTRPPELCVWKGLPRGSATGGFFGGHWEQFGWQRGQVDPGSILRS